MNNLTTRKIVLGMLMVLVLAFSVQGTADAITGFTPSFTPGDLNNRAEGDSITVSGFPSSVNLNNVREYVSLSVSGGGAKFPNPTDNSRTVTTYTWRETDSDSSDGTNHNDATLPDIGDQTITVNSQGEVTVRVSYTETYDTTRSRTTSVVRTYYVVKDRLDVNLSDTIRLRGVTNGVGYPYDHRSDIQIYAGDSRHNEVTYTFGPGSLYIKEGNRYRSLSTGGATSSRAEVWLSMGRRGVTDGALGDRPTTGGTTNTVIAEVTGNGNETTGLYIYGRPQLSETLTLGKTLTTGRPGLKVSPAITVTVRDETSGTAEVPNVPVTFKVANTTSQGGLLSYPSDTLEDEKIDANNNVLKKPPLAASTLHVRTNGSGQAIVDFEFGSAGGEQEITVTAVGMTKTVKALDATTSTRDISIRSEKRSGSNEYDLYVTVTDNGIKTPGVSVTFITISGGELTNTPSTGDAITLDSVSDLTNSVGIAQVIYDPLGASGTLQISVSLLETGTVPTTGVKTLRRTFNVRGGSRGGGGDPDPPPVITRGSLNIATSGSGNTRTVTVTASRAGTVAPGISVLLNVNNGATLTRRSGGTPLTSTLTLPATAGTYTLTATTTADYTGDSETITVTLPGTLLLALVGTENNGAHTLQVIVQNSVGTRVTTPVTVTLSGAGISRTVSVTGSGNVPIALPTTSGTLFARATGYNSGSITLPARTTTPTTGTIGTTTTTTTTTTTDDPPEPSRINIVGSATRSENTANQQLDQPLLVQVLDDDDDGVEDARVIFRVKTGQGRLSQRGNGRAIAVQTDARGHARATYTPMSASSTVEAEAKGVTRKATFTITTGAAPATDTTGTTGSYKAGDKIPGTLSRTFSGKITINGQTYTCTSSGECVISNGFVTKGQIEVSDTTTPGTSGTPRATEINPVVQVNAANRPPMLWVDGGAIYALVGKDVQKFVLSVDNALNIAVGGGKVYWTEKTGESGGTINSANLDGTGVTELASIFATPIGIAVDIDGSKLYWTNSSGRIQSANLDGSRITNVLRDLPSPMDIALAGGNAYWTQGGNVRFVNLKGTKQIRNVSTGTDTAGSLVIGGGKVYWTEKTAASAGTVNSANLDGTGVRELTSIRSVPMGIAVDTAGRKLYWTASSGKVKQANLNGSGAKNVVSGLDSPSDMVLSNSIAAPAATPTTRTTTTASRSKYDVNGDGTVDNADAALVADAMGTSNTKYDVNGDGTVNFLDLLLVFDNRDAGAAGAPTVVGMKMSAAQIDIIEEQIDLLIATNDRSPAAMRTLVYLQQLLVTARPEKTQLLANYPNPFNPETWIPYELATDTNVRLTIYNTQGVVIRTMPLGHQSAGYYTGRDRAAYWDGRNAFGEQVASGLYFYQLETDEMSSMRKMVILK